MKFLGLFSKKFRETTWTTLGNKVYYPSSVKPPIDSRYDTIIKHELLHVKQYEKYSIPGFLFLYFLFPVPIFFAYFRWKFEREAYLIDIKSGRLTIDQVVDTLWKNYGYVWFKPLMKRWFEKNLK